MRKITNIFSIRRSCLLLLLSFCMTAPPADAEVIYATPLKANEHMIGHLLEWSTASEDNSKRFVVEKSIDGVQFQDVGVVEAAGDSDDQRAYRFLDVNATDQKSFYRLRQLDTDGTASFSQTVKVDKVLMNEFMVVSMTNTTTTGSFSLNIDALNGGQLSYSLESIKGELIFEDQLPLDFGLNQLSVNLEHEKEGVFKLKLQKGEELETLVIRKIDDEITKKENVASQRRSHGG
ncbi:MAG: hypothetical protein AAGG75_06835 [Bacteroidota bacterium]